MHFVGVIYTDAKILVFCRKGIKTNMRTILAENLEHLSKLLDTLADLEKEKQTLLYTPYSAKQTKDYVMKMDSLETEIEKTLHEIQLYREIVIDYISDIEDAVTQQILFYVYISRLPLCQISSMLGNAMTTDDIMTICKQIVNF